MQTTISPIDGKIIVEREYASSNLIESTLAAASTAQLAWRQTSIEHRVSILREAIAVFESQQNEIAEEITLQIGRPIAHSPGEVKGFAERALAMIELAPQALADIIPKQQIGFTRFMRREPLGIISIIAPWNYPYLTAVNTLVPALIAGNAVTLKHSRHTPLCAERLTRIFLQAGLPAGLLNHLHMDHSATEKFIQDPRISFVAFTGSVLGGQYITKSLANTFTPCGLELGGKDPAYVCADADLIHTVPNLVEGVYFNAGQSCCGIERIYVDETLFDDFVSSFVELTKKYRLDDPRDLNTTLGPMITSEAADRLRKQIQLAVSQGAKPLLPSATSSLDRLGSAYLSPQVLINVNHKMAVMREENFGPIVGIMPVKNQDEAIQLMNDSSYGLTASVWTQDQQRAVVIGEQLETGTVLMNRCDYLDPQLAWTGVKNTGRGITLSVLGYQQLSRIKSYHLLLNGNAT